MLEADAVVLVALVLVPSTVDAEPSTVPVSVPALSTGMVVADFPFVAETLELKLTHLLLVEVAMAFRQL